MTTDEYADGTRRVSPRPGTLVVIAGVAMITALLADALNLPEHQVTAFVLLATSLTLLASIGEFVQNRWLK